MKELLLNKEKPTEKSYKSISSNIMISNKLNEHKKYFSQELLLTLILNLEPFSSFLYES